MDIIRPMNRLLQGGVSWIVSQRCASTNIAIPALIDSYPIQATHFTPFTSSQKSICVVISQATGIRRQFYFPFAEYLSQKHHLDVVTYDYRGTNEQKASEWTLLEHWARRDAAGVLSYAFQNYDQVVHLGHSFGGNLLALLPMSINRNISRALLISAANSYLMYHKWNRAFISTLLSLYALREPLIWVYGYYPMRRVFRTGVDLPKNILRQWARWSLMNQCFVDDHGQPIKEGFESVRCPLVTIHFEDDEFYRREAFDQFDKHFRHASTVQRWHLPYGGHFNFFKEKDSHSLWPDVSEYLVSGRIDLSRHLETTKSKVSIQDHPN